ncbi:MAG: hypothetical protein Q7J32_03500 [Sphingomonadaceae bacterium]|nr:hypothetical protein [Sphingomonadaceae bacterium]
MRFYAMTLHFFHIRSGSRVELDGEGTDCADLAAAKRHAVTLAGTRVDSDDTDWRIEIADEAGQYLASIDRQGVVAD